MEIEPTLSRSLLCRWIAEGKSRKKRIVLRLFKRTQKALKHGNNGDTNSNCNTCNGSQSLHNSTGIYLKWKPNRDISKKSLVKIVQNTQKSSVDLRKHQITWNLMKDHQLMLIWEARKMKYYYSLIRAFPISISRWFFTRVWVTASLLKFPGLFLVFWPFSIMQPFGWSPLVHQLPGPLVPFVIL